MNENVIIERKKDILKIVDSLDITPTMHKNAVDKYTAIVSVLENNGINAHIYPQGSFAIGTVVKPKKGKGNADYDLDVICEVNYNKHEITPLALYDKLKVALENNGTYSSKLEYYDECITINYSDVNGIGFSIDIVPSVHEDQETIVSMKSHSTMPELCDSSIAITIDKALDWGSSNPKGFQAWFEKINQKFLDYGIYTNREQILNENRALFASADEIPKSVVKTPLQRVIQLLKIHNNEFFDKPKIKDYKVKSVIIATLVTSIASNAPNYYDTFNLLKYVLDNLSIYTSLKENYNMFRSLHPNDTIIQYDGKTWYIENPSNPEDNLANSWNENTENAICFFNWIKALLNDFNLINDINDSTGMLNVFGESILNKTDIGRKYISKSSQLVSNTSKSQPWMGCYYEK